MFREQLLINRIVRKLQLKLDGLTILTEVGSNNYIYTPIIAIMAGAEKVFAWTQDSKYGKGEQIIKDCLRLCEKFDIDYKKIEFANNTRPEEHIKKADIITNLGFIRPMNKEFLKNLKSTSVIPYMCESWEVRDADVDIDYCKLNHIPVAGTWENHPDLMIFEFCGNLIVKLCLEAGFEIRQNNILIISNDNFGTVAYDSFINLGATTVRIVSTHDFDNLNLNNIDFILLADYSSSKEIFNIDRIKRLQNHNISIVHLSGMLNFNQLEVAGINVYPRISGNAKRMTKTLEYLGPKPVIDLHAAGLKVGELLFNKQTSNLIQTII
jgi:hypothetical protein